MMARRVWLTPLPRTAVSRVGFGGRPRCDCGSGCDSEEAVSSGSPRACKAAFSGALVLQLIRMSAGGTGVGRRR